MSAKLAIIGAGKMGEAIVAGVRREANLEHYIVVASAPRAQRRAELTQRFPTGVSVVATNSEAVEEASVVVLCNKPQMFDTVAKDVAGRLRPDALVMSIMAGKRIEAISAALNHRCVVRAMPNVPATINEGITVWCAAPTVSGPQRDAAKALLLTLGREIAVDDEKFLDMATAISGTGPSYFFLVMEALTDAGVQIGFPRHVAQQLVQQTMLGSVRYAIESGKHPAMLKNDVTSPGGTSAAALYQCEKGGLRTVLTDAVIAAYERSLQLGK